MEVGLDDADLALLRDFLSVAGDQGVRPMLIGAGARRLSLELRRKITGARATTDWDFGVRIESWDGWERLRKSLLAGPGLLFAETRLPHRLLHHRGRLLDIVPFGGIESTPGEIIWPDKMRMSVRAFQESEPLAEAIEVSGLRVDVASVPSWALLKLEAYSDRRRDAQTKDIQDFVWLLENYEQACDPERVHRELSEFLRDDVIDAECAGSMLLGIDTAAIHTRATIATIARVLEEASDPYSRLVNDAIKNRRPNEPDQEDELRARVTRQIAVFLKGLDLGGGGRA